MTALAKTATDQAFAGQRAALSVLLAEMTALMSLIPGQGPDRADDSEARHLAQEALVEAEFDNMPV